MLLSVALATGLLAYNTVTNLRWPGDRWYVPRNVLLAAGLIGLGRWLGLSWDDLGLGREALAVGLWWGSGVITGVAVAFAVVLALAPRSGALTALLEDRRADLTDRELAWQTLVRIPVGTAAFEEVAFRGVLLGWAMTAHGTVGGVLLSAVAFGLWHIGPTLATLDLNQQRSGRGRAVFISVLATTAAGVALAILRLASSLVAVVLVHWAANALGLLAAAAQRRS